jgi:hypothetical protein
MWKDAELALYAILSLSGIHSVQEPMKFRERVRLLNMILSH